MCFCVFSRAALFTFIIMLVGWAWVAVEEVSRPAAFAFSVCHTAALTGEMCTGTSRVCSSIDLNV